MSMSAEDERLMRAAQNASVSEMAAKMNELRPTLTGWQRAEPVRTRVNDGHDYCIKGVRP